MKLHIVVSVLLISVVGSSLAQMAQGLRKLDLEGTWSWLWQCVDGPRFWGIGYVFQSDEAKVHCPQDVGVFVQFYKRRIL